MKMAQTVIHLFQNRRPASESAEAPQQHESSTDDQRQKRLRVATAISLCLLSLIEDAEAAELTVTAAGLLVAIDALSAEIARI
jgi:hypothetical protein